MNLFPPLIHPKTKPNPNPTTQLLQREEAGGSVSQTPHPKSKKKKLTPHTNTHMCRVLCVCVPEREKRAPSIKPHTRESRPPPPPPPPPRKNKQNLEPNNCSKLPTNHGRRKKEREGESVFIHTTRNSHLSSLFPRQGSVC